MRTRYIALFVAMMLIASAGVANAALIGTSVTGTLAFGGGGTNYFDPANGFVPAGPENTAGPTVIINTPQVEFGFADGANHDTADFTDTTLTVTDLSVGGGTNWVMTFKDAAFVGLNLLETSDTFAGGVTGGIVGDTLTVTWGGAGTGGNFVATFNLTAPGGGGSGVPLPPAVYAGAVCALLALKFRKTLHLA